MAAKLTFESNIRNFQRRLAHRAAMSVTNPVLFVRKIGLSIYQSLIMTTPVDTGNARAGWRIEMTDGGVRIWNEVSYIDILDRGRVSSGRQLYGSKQAPWGITEPVLKLYEPLLASGAMKAVIQPMMNL